MISKPYLLLVAAASAIAAPATAETLADALAAAYASNPDLAAQRAVVRQFDELVPQALSAARPQVTPSVSLSQEMGPSFQNEGRLFGAGITISQPLFRGGRTRSSVSAGEQRIFAARARLRQVENQVLVSTVTAYADVLRAQQVVELNQNQVRVLETNLRASRDRFEVGDLTRTDVAQSEARLEVARANLIVAQGNLIAARQAYQRIVGRPPSNLAPIPPLPPLPNALAPALETARENNPALLAARFDEGAARNDVRTVQGERLPTVGVNVGANYTNFFGAPNGLGALVRDGFNPTASVSASFPLLAGGNIASRARQAQARQSELLENISATERQVTESVTNAFEQIAVARSVRQSALAGIAANELALEGTRQENQVGSRTILEVLNAEQELLNTRVDLVQAERNLVVAGYQLLATTGQAEAVALGLPVERYDAESNARRVRAKWSDFGGLDPDPRTTPGRNSARVTGVGTPPAVTPTPNLGTTPR